MVEALRRLTDSVSTVVAVATVQEEVGSRVAVVAGSADDPDVCIAIDFIVARDIPDARPQEEVTQLGRSPAINVIDTTLLSDPGIVCHLRDLAERDVISVHLEVLNHGGADDSLVQRLRAGVATVTISIPARYIPIVNETVAVSREAARPLSRRRPHTRWPSSCR